MIQRNFWLSRIHGLWTKAPIVWLSGVRRVGKTTLSKSLADAEFINCDLPSSHLRLGDPEAFFRSISKPWLILDEVHQLPDPSRVLKIAADAFPHLKLVATGSSTLAATSKFRDSLAGRKRNLHLVPVRHDELEDFGVRDLSHRLFRGGLPPALLAQDYDAGFYSEWLDSYYARDVQELFRVEKRSGFLKLVESVLRLSGGQLEATTMANLCGLSRPTVVNYLEVLELTHAAIFVRPYFGGGPREIVRQPKVYGFDTGFVAFAKGWNELRSEDLGLLWEHLVLEKLISDPSEVSVMYWRNKAHHEVDFVLPRGRGVVDAIECKWDASRFEPTNLKAFRALHPEGKNIAVCSNVFESYTRQVAGMEVTFTGLDTLSV